MRHVLLFLLLAIGTAAVAQQPPAQRRIEVAANAPWTHARSGVTLPAEVGELRRVGIVENAPSEVDILAHYEDRATRVTVILFRPQQNDVGFWFDRSELALPANPMFAGLAPTTAEPVRFATSISPTMSSLRRSYSSTGRWRGTGTAVMPVGRWLVKIRASSAALDAAAIDRLIDSTIAAIRLPADATAAPEARIIAACADSLRWREAQMVQPSMEDVLMASATLAIVAEAEPTEPDRPHGLAQPDLCRDPIEADGGTVYRSPGETGLYWIGYGDSGAFATVAPALSLDELTDSPSRRGNARLSVTLATPTDSLVYPNFDRLPTPRQVTAMLNSRGPISRTSFDPEAPEGNRPEIQITTPP